MTKEDSKKPGAPRGAQRRPPSCLLVIRGLHWTGPGLYEGSREEKLVVWGRFQNDPQNAPDGHSVRFGGMFSSTGRAEWAAASQHIWLEDTEWL